MIPRQTGALWLAILAVVMLLGGCSNEYVEALKEPYQRVGNQLELLGSNIDSKALANGRLIEHYASSVSASKPELADIANTLAKDATRDGPLYQGLKQRYNTVNFEPNNQQEYQQAITELESLYIGSDPAIFNDAQIDVVNTLADLSGGVLPRVNIPANSKTENVKGTPAGSYLVGNPSYGEWKQDSSGNSFWEFYGKYALLSTVVDGVRGLTGGYNNRPIMYDDWNSRPRNSYYRDYGWKTYGSTKDYTTKQTLDNKMRSAGVTPAKPTKTYGSVEGQKRLSTYTTLSGNRSNQPVKSVAGDGPRHASSTPKRSSNLFGSTASKPSSSYSSSSSSKRSSSLFGSSARSGSSRSSSSSSSRGGK